ncbi:MAG: RagB/SusD family nutrient uptake outer membrane protein [Gemmatimonadota bacterium]|nr:RagB/SusD family nutrient uptake outer membrane protein [Gemmatimonadota bacterium]
MKRYQSVLLAALAIAPIAGCKESQLDITNPNSPTVAAAATDPQALQLLATGLLRQLRNSKGAYILNTGIFGREAFNYTPQEPRNVSNFLVGLAGQNKLDPNGFAAGNWATQYGNLRDVFNFKNLVNGSSLLTATQKSAALGFDGTIEAIELLEVIATHDTLGAVVEIKQNASDLAPFVSRDSVYKYILNTLDAADAQLAAGGTAFPITLHSGFAGFNTPTTFRKFNRAIAAKAAAYYATSGGGAAAWTRSLAANSASFVNTSPTSKADLDAGPFHPYAAAPDVNNPVNGTTSTDLFAHPSILTDVPRKADGSLDNRYTAKVFAKAERAAPGGFGIASALGLSVYAGISTPIAIIRNEELILLRAEALLATGDKAGAITLINTIRTVSGGLAPSTLTTASSDDAVLTELLLQKRYSLLLEGDRWIDLRRYGRLSTLPLDITTGANAHFVAKVQPIPAAECLVRAGKGAAVAAPGC